MSRFFLEWMPWAPLIVLLLGGHAVAREAAAPAAVNLRHNDPQAQVAAADALLQQQRPGEGILMYRNALRSSTDKDSVMAKIAAAEAHRRVLLDRCQSTPGAEGRRACEAAWLPGAPDEAEVIRRRAILLQSDNQPSAALDAYLAAARLRPDDATVAQAIVSLSASTGRKDAVTLVARQRALSTLGRPTRSLDKSRSRLPVRPIASGDSANRFSNEAPVTRSN